MSYNYRIPQINLYDAYNAFVEGEPEKGRKIIRKYYENGINNPRACLFEASKEVNRLNVWAKEWDTFLSSSLSRKEIEIRQQRHRETINEMMYPHNARIQEALDNLYCAFRSQYDKSRSMSEYIISKEYIPEFKIFRKFAKILFR